MKKNADVLDDLIKINNDRVKGYEKAAKETDVKDADLRILFHNMAAESRQYANELEGLLAGRGNSPEDETTIGGDIYRAWMDVKNVFTGKDRKSILASCEYGEDAAQKAYEKALDNDDISGDVRQVLVDQKARLRKSHDTIKRMRDTQPA